MKNLSLSLLLIVVCAALVGCASNPCVVGHVVSGTDRGFGSAMTSSTTSANGSPTIRLGFFSSTVIIEPVLTNAVASVPGIANTFALDQATSPFLFGVDETFASGNYQTLDPTATGTTNSMTSQPIVAK